jgi:hypothetical protein
MLSLSSKSTLLSLRLSMLVKGVTPSTSFLLDFVSAPESRSDTVDLRRPPLHLQLCQLKRIHALRTVSGKGDSASVSVTVAALGEATFDEQALVSPVTNSSSSLLLGISDSPRNGSSLTLTSSRPSLAYLVQSHLAPRYCVGAQYSHVLRWIQACRSKAPLRPNV